MKWNWIILRHTWQYLTVHQCSTEDWRKSVNSTLTNMEMGSFQNCDPASKPVFFLEGIQFHPHRTHWIFSSSEAVFSCDTRHDIHPDSSHSVKHTATVYLIPEQPSPPASRGHSTLLLLGVTDWPLWWWGKTSPTPPAAHSRGQESWLGVTLLPWRHTHPVSVALSLCVSAPAPSLEGSGSKMMLIITVVIL